MNLIVFPIILPLMAAIGNLAFAANRRLQTIFSIVANAIQVGVAVRLFLLIDESGPRALQLGGWTAPIGISLVADTLSCSLVLVSTIVFLLIGVFADAYISTPQRSKFYSVLTAFMAMGVNGAFLTGDFFNLYVWFEVFLVASFALLALDKGAALRGTVKYIAINLLGSAVFLLAAGLLYQSAGTLNMADVAEMLQRWREPGLIRLVPLLFLFAFLLKAAAFPVGNWLLAAYPLPNYATTALFAALLSKIGVYTILRVFSVVFNNEIYFTHDVLLWVGLFTMVTGVLSAATRWEIRQILSVHIISQVGYMILSLALYTPQGMGAAFFFLVHNIFVKTTLFLTGAYLYRLYRKEDIRRLGGIAGKHPRLAAGFILAAFALAGLPPTTGFWGKMLIAKSCLEVDYLLGLFISLAVSVLTLYSMVKIWNEVFSKPAPAEEKEVVLSRRERWALGLPIGIFVVIFTLLGLFPDFLLRVSTKVGNELAQPFQYRESVLKPEGLK